ncbi:signal peptide peptidase-like 2A isoform X2 [Polypterus senegalus]|uniref:signal peptide peptidase-like 2A isoform X2 n=1 Tax=Polypterus senegalus TaxID=55291 RepID=UPI001963D8DC|nr:signal peptide peptidase-like 2A isoform X2 [Polypterus senegalus]
MEWLSAFNVYMFVLFSLQVNAQNGVMQVSEMGSLDEQNYCFSYNSNWTPLPPNFNSSLRIFTSTLLCKEDDIPVVVKGLAIVVMRGDCSFSEKAIIAQKKEATALLVASNNTLAVPSGNSSSLDKVNIPVVVVRYTDVQALEQHFKGNMTVKLSVSVAPLFDSSILVLFLIGVLTVALGGYWSGAAERNEMDSQTALEGDGRRTEKSDVLIFSPLKIVVFVGIMCGMLLLLYFFYKWLVYLIICIFCIASAMALFHCLSVLLEKVPYGRCSFSCRSKTVEIRMILLGAACITLSVIWAVYRNEDSWVWILQDFLGVAFCLNFLRVIKISSFKLHVILLSLLLVYDVFFVFITPLLTKNGESIMIDVASGGGSSDEKNGGSVLQGLPDSTSHREKLPVLMRVPRLNDPAQNVCGIQFSILGYGDIIVPGLLVAYCHRFDIWANNSSRIYFISCTIAYAFGMGLTLLVLLLTKMGQPALLYLVPCTLITSSIVAWRRKQMRQFWVGSNYEVAKIPEETPAEN